MRLTPMIVALMVAATMCVRVVSAQERLEPEQSALDENDEYYALIRQAFADAYTQDVVARVVILPAMRAERVVGIRKTDRGFEAFVMKPSAMISGVQMLRDYEAGKNLTLDKNGNPLPLDKDPSYLELKKRVPADIKQVEVTTETAEISEQLTNDIAGAWQKMILDAQYPAEGRNGYDGETWHFSMWIRGRGTVGAQVWSPGQQSKTLALVNLARAISEYAEKQSEVRGITEALRIFK